MRLMFLALSLFSLRAMAVYNVGDPVSNLGWTDDQGQVVHLQDDGIKDTIRVLLYNAGWCGPCNNEFDELRDQWAQFDGQPVTFISLSAQDYNHKAPDQSFLQSWRSAHGIPANVYVAASPNDYGSEFETPPLYIPNVAIINRDGTLAYKATAPGADAIVQEVQSLLSSASK